MANNASEILTGLFIGNAKCSEQHGGQFDMIVNCTYSLPFPLDCKWGVRIPVNDDPFDSVPLYQILRDGTELADMHELLTGGKKVLVHCAAGAQRSPTVVACYLMRYHGLSPEEAIAQIRSKRPVAFFWGINLYRAIELYSRYLETTNSPTLT